MEALVDDSEAQQLETNEKAASAAALASVLQHMQHLQPNEAVVKPQDQEDTGGRQQQQQSSARHIDPRVLRADRLKAAAAGSRFTSSPSDRAHRAAPELLSSTSAAAASEDVPASRHISVENVGSTSKWTQVAGMQLQRDCSSSQHT